MINKIKQLKNHQGFKKYFANTSWLFGEKILRMGVGLFVGIWVARYLGPEKFGILSYAQAFVGLFSAVAMLGLNSIVVKELIDCPEKEEKILSTSFILKITIAFILMCLIFTISPLFNSGVENLLIYILSFAWIFQSFNIIDFYFQSKVISKYVIFANSFSLIISSIIKILLILNKASLIYFAIIIVFDNIIVACGYIYWYLRIKKNFFQLKFDFNIAKELLFQSWPLILSGMSFVVYNNIDKIMIQKMLNPYEVGIYTAAVRLTSIWQFVPGLIVSSLMPYLVEGYKKNEIIFHNRLKLVASILIWLSIIISLIYLFFGKKIILLTFGKSYLPSTEIMFILIWTNVFIFFNTVWNRWKVIEHNSKITFYFSLLTAVLNTLFNYIFIKEFGVIGASYGILLSLFISYVVFYIVLDIKVIKLFIKSLFFIKIKGIK